MSEEKLLSSDMVASALKAKSLNRLRSLLKKLEAADIAEALSELTIEDCALAFRLVPRPRKPQVFSYFPAEMQRDLLDVFPDDAVTLLLNAMEPVDRTKLLEELSPEISSKIILRLEPEERKMTWRLLSYPEDSVGRIMSPEFYSVRAGQSVAQAIDDIRWHASRYPEEALQHIFVVDKDQKYLGDVRLGTFFVADPSSQPVEGLVGSSYVSLSAFDNESVAVDIFRKYDKTHVAVVDDQNKLVGVVTADDIFDVAEEEATEDIQQFGGSGSLEDSYFQTPLLVLLRKRAGWLMVLFFGGFWSTHALKSFQDSIAVYAFLVVFMPLVISSGGNTGSQAASLVIRGITLKEIELKHWYRVLMREALTGSMLGLVLGGIGYFFAVFSGGISYHDALVILFSIMGVVLLGGIVGAMLPFGLKRVGLDPAVSSSPLIASLADFFGIILFFNIAIYVLSKIQS